MSELPGLGGSLFPSRYLAEQLTLDVQGLASANDLARREGVRRQCLAWWQTIESSCGPATGLRAIFDLIAVPLFGRLGFRVTAPIFRRDYATGTLLTMSATPVALVILPWAARRSSVWRDLVVAAGRADADWCFLLSPPYLSLVDARGQVTRRGLDVTLPHVFDTRAFPRFWVLAHAKSFDRTGNGSIPLLDALVERSSEFQQSVRTDLQAGVVYALRRLLPMLRESRDESLTVIFRLLFLLFAESRDLVPRSHPVYRRSYTVEGLCREALTRDDPAGLWDGLAAISRLSRSGCRTGDLIVRPFNGALFAQSAAPALERNRRGGRHGGRSSAKARDDAMRDVLVALGTRAGAAGRESIAYADLGVEQLGAVYERLLDIEPVSVNTTVSYERPTSKAHSRVRKETGTFYTPQALADFVVRRTLAPLVTGASSDAILSLRVLDPAMGSGAFLVSACRYLADAYEHAVIEEGRFASADIDRHRRADFRRLIAERCLTGVDLNPVAVQLARLSIWLTTLVRGLPLGFLDHRLRTGNSLIGARPDDLARLDGRRNATRHNLPLFDEGHLEQTMSQVAIPLRQLGLRRDDSADAVRAKTQMWQRLSGVGSPLAVWRQAMDVWCARWFTASPPNAAELRAIMHAVLEGDVTLPSKTLAHRLAEAGAAASSERFFHWPLEFADVFYDDTGQPKPTPGFDAIIGNPPWEMLRREPSDPVSRNRRGMFSFLRESGQFTACDEGHLNLYQPFVERAVQLTRREGRIGLVLPWGLASDVGAEQLRRLLIDDCALDTVVGLDNAEGLFPIHRGLRFLVAVASPGAKARDTRARFGVRTAAELDALPGCDDSADASSFPLRLSRTFIRRIGGPTRRLPDIRDARDLELLDSLTSRFPALGSADGWAARFGRELNATEDRDAFSQNGLPVVEGKHIAPFVVHLERTTARIARSAAERLLADLRFDRPRLAYRDVSGVGNRCQLIAAVLPAACVTTHTLFCLRTPIAIQHQFFLSGLFNSLVLNAVVRMLMGSHVTTRLVEDLPVPPWTGSVNDRRIARLAERLSRRRSDKCEARLQAAAAHAFGLDATAFAKVLDGFPRHPPEWRQAVLMEFQDPVFAL